MHRWLLILFCLCANVAQGQYDSLAYWAHGSLHDSVASLRLSHGAKLQAALIDSLERKGPHWAEKDFPYQNIMVQWSDDQRLATFTFAIPDENGMYQFLGAVASRGRRKTSPYIITSLGGHSLQHPDGHRTLSDHVSARPGSHNCGLIYDILTIKHRRQTQYVALIYYPAVGVQHYQSKSIEPIIIGRRGIYFGASVFDVPVFNDRIFRRPAMRLTMHYSTSHAVSLRSDKPTQITIENVVPMQGAPAGMYRLYGPTLDEDILRFERGRWSIQKVNLTP